jgi:HD domain
MTLAIETIAVPDTRLARTITELVRDTESPLLFHHSSRVYHWGALAGRRRGLKFDAELLYAGAMFHDMGLTPPHSSATERFEVDGANAARDFLREQGIAHEDIATVWTAIALHTTPGIPQHMHPVVALLTAGVEMDVLGLWRVQRRRARGRRRGAPAQPALQGGHHPSLLRRQQAQAEDDFRQRQCRRDRGQGPDVPSYKFLQRHPQLGLARLTLPGCIAIRGRSQHDNKQALHQRDRCAGRRQH